MLQLIINQTEKRETMIISSEDNKKVFMKNKTNEETKEAKLFDEIVLLVNKYFEYGEL